MRVALTVILGLVAISAQAATYQISGGNWESTRTWNYDAPGTPDFNVYDNGATPPDALINGSPGVSNYTVGDTGVPGNPPVQAGTYSGTIVTDGANNVVGGTLQVTGNIGKEIRIGLNSFWFIQYTDLLIDFSAGAATANFECWRTVLAPAACSDVLATYNPEVYSWVPLAGNEGVIGASRAAATFDGATLNIFHEGYNGAGGSDYSQLLVLTAEVVPIPAAVWLFGSALFGLGRMRRKVTA